MSDKGSQHGSIRAGYRRSRIEPVDPATISAPPPNAPSPNGQPARSSSVASKKDDEKKEGICKKIMRVLFLFINIIFMSFAVMMIILGVVLWIVFREAGLSILDVADGAPLSKIKLSYDIYIIYFSLDDQWYPTSHVFDVGLRDRFNFRSQKDNFVSDWTNNNVRIQHLYIHAFTSPF